MKIKSSLIPEYTVEKGNGLKKKGNAFALDKKVWTELLKSYEKVEVDGQKSVVELNGSKFLFAYDEDTKQNILFVDGYLVTKVKSNGTGVDIFTTYSDEPFDTLANVFANEKKITNFTTDYETAKANRDEIEAAKKEVVKYFEIKIGKEPRIAQEEAVIDAKKKKIDTYNNVTLKEIAEKRKEQEELLKEVGKDDKKRKDIIKKMDELDKQKAEVESKVDSLQAELDGRVVALRKKVEERKDAMEATEDQKQKSKFQKEIKKYQEEIESLTQEEAIAALKDEIKKLENKKSSNEELISNNTALLNLVKTRADEQVSGKTVKPDSSLESAEFYAKEIKKCQDENANIDAKIAKYQKQLAKVKRVAESKLGLEAKLKLLKDAYYEELGKAVTSDLARRKITEIEEADYSQVVSTQANGKEETVAEKTLKIEQAKAAAAEADFAAQLETAEKNVVAKQEALRKNKAGSLYVRAQEVCGQPKYRALYNKINGYTPVFTGADVTLNDKPGYGCIIVGPKLNDETAINGFSKGKIDRAMYIIVGKTVEEVENSLPETAADFLKLREEGAKVYSAKNIVSTADYKNAYAEVYANTDILKDAAGNPILDPNKKQQFVSSNMIHLEFDIKSGSKKNGKEVEEKPIDFTTPETLEAIKVKLGSKDGMNTEVRSYWQEDYTKKKRGPVVKKVALVALVLGAAAVSAVGGYHVYQQAKTNEGQQELIDDQKLAFETEEAIKFGKEQCGNNAFKYEYDKNGNVVMGEVVCADLTKDVETYKQEGRSNNDVYENYTKDGYVAQYVYNTTMELGKQGNILKIDGNSLFDDYFKNIEFTTYTSDTENYPKDALGNVLTAHQKDLARDAYEEAVAELLKADEKVSESSAINPFNEVIIDAAQSKVNKDLKGTKKTMVVKGVYIDFNADTAFAVANEGESEGKYIVKITYADDIKTLDDAVVYMTNADSSYYTCAAANPNFPGTAYQDYYVSNDTTHNGNVYSKNFIKAERDGVKYTFTEFKGYDVLNTNTEKMPSSNNIAYLSLAGSAAHAIDGLEIVGDMGEKTEYTSEIPEDVSTNSNGQIFGYQKEGKTK